MTTNLTEIEEDHRKARRFFSSWLVGATALTLGGNAANAALDAIDPTVIKMSVHLIPPIIALVAIHGIAVLSRSGGKRRALKVITEDRMFLGTLIVTGLLALVAAVLSYAGLYEVALSGGLHQNLAWLFPLTIDAGIGVSSVALVALRPANADDVRAAKSAEKVRVTPAASAQVTRPATRATDPKTTRRGAPATLSGDRVPTPDGAAADPQTILTPTRQGAVTDPELTALATRIVASGAVRQPVEVVAAILAELESGGGIKPTAARLGLTPGVVRNVRDAAAAQVQDQPDRQLTAVG